MQKFFVALLEEDVDLALSYFEQLTRDDLYAVSSYVRPLPIVHMKPFFARPEYQRILREAGLDDESIAKLEFPPLRF